MLKEITKRDGRKVPFDLGKIEEAIVKAFESCNIEGGIVSKKLAIDVYETLDSLDEKSPSVEHVQDVVEKVLLKQGYIDVAKRYIIYRQERTNIRENNTKLMNIFKSITFDKSEENDIRRENANVNGDTAMGIMLKFGSEGSKEFSKKFLLKPQHAQAHDNGDIHIHDLDFYHLTTTCCQIDLTKLYKNGFSTGQGHIREPQSIGTYAALACIAIQSNQNDQHGGQSVPAFDYDMAPGVRKTYGKNYRNNLMKVCVILKPDFDVEKIVKFVENNTPVMCENERFIAAFKKEFSKEFNDTELEQIINFTEKEAYKETDKQTYQAMESLIHNLNTMQSRAGAQVPFSSINYGTDTSCEARMVIRNLLIATENGLGNGETAIFPIQIFKVKEGVNYNVGDPNYDLFELSCRVSAKRLFPNYSFLDAPFNKQYYKPGNYHTEIAYMGCRTRVISNVDTENEIVTGRGNLSFTSINLPRLGIEANKNIPAFFKKLDATLDLCIDQLYQRYLLQISKHVYNYPFLMGQGVWINSEKLDWNDTVEEVLKHGTLSVGFIGLAETLVALTGKHHGESEESQELGLKIIKFMRDKMDCESLKSSLNWSLLATPAEGLSGRFVKMDKKRYGSLEGITNHEFYTNSFHIPVYYKISAFKKLEIEGKYHELTNAGHISYVELDGDPSKNLEAFIQIVRAMRDSNVGYGSINHPIDRDPVCGYNGIIDDVCPKCGRREEGLSFERIRRITGYLVGTLDRFNNAKLNEVRERVKHGLTRD